MSRGRVAICALIAMFTFAALGAAPALAKKEYKREFEASGAEVKLETQSLGTGYQFIFPFEEKGKGFASKKIKCAEVAKGAGEIHTTEGKATSFIDKVTFGGCTAEKKKFLHEVKIPPIEWEFHTDGTVSIVNEVKILYNANCTIILDAGQTVGKEEVEEGKKGPVAYTQIGKSAPEGIPKVEVKIKTRTHEEGEVDGLEYEGEGGDCENAELKFEGGKFKGNMIVHAKETKENPWIGFKEELLPKEKK